MNISVPILAPQTATNNIGIWKEALDDALYISFKSNKKELNRSI